MDKMFDVIIVGGDFSSLQRLINREMPSLRVVRAESLIRGQVGKNPNLMIWDEVTHVDFSELETRAAAMMLGEQIHEKLATGRLSKDSPEFQELPGVDALHDKAWGELLHQTLESQEARAVLKDSLFYERYYSRGSAKTMASLANLLGVSELTTRVGADDPSRKREPKGPRKKWGKLK